MGDVEGAGRPCGLAGWLRDRVRRCRARNGAVGTSGCAPSDGDRGILAISASERYEDGADGFVGRLERLLRGKRSPPFPSFTGCVEQPEPKKIGIACSGGGIRSAAFGLGALQVLQERDVLKRAKYLAGVSGGSYIAAAFCMVRQTGDGDDSDPAVVNDDHPPFFPGSPEEQYLRNRASYMAPGVFGKLQLGYRLILGMTINLTFIAFALVTFAVPLALLYGWLCPSLTSHVVKGGLCRRAVTEPGHPVEHHDALCNLLPLHIPLAVWLVPASGAVLALAMGIIGIITYRRPTQLGESPSLRLLLFFLGLGFALVGLPILLSLVRAWGTVTHQPASAKHVVNGVEVPTQPTTASAVSTPAAVAAGAGGIATLGSAVLLQLRSDWAQAKRVARDAGGVKKWYASLSPRVRRGLAYVIAAIVGPALALLIALEAMSIALNLPHPWERWTLAGGLALTFLLAYRWADMTKWSLHSFYRRRLCSAFALRRIARRPGDPPIAERDAGIALARDYNNLVTLSNTAVRCGAESSCWPTLLVCAAANISDTAATPPGRAVTSFTFSATAMGGPLIGAVRTEQLESVCDEKRISYFTLPAAVAMSGAALSPSMGKMTRSPLRFLLALANVRLGVWVPNPRRLGKFQAVSTQAGRLPKRYPSPRPSYLLRELLGLNPLNAPYVYVTDGGHYENLGVVELLRRGCTEIYCFDASNDDFDALGDAVSLARSELDVEIDIKYGPLQVNASTGLAETDCVSASITYPHAGAPPAKIYYARLALTADAPADAIAYHKRDAHFPHDPTTDQLYTDQRFEAYRGLGASAAKTALRLSGR